MTIAKGYVVNIRGLPDKFPTHAHPSSFWESLGRAVATFGFLEETLTKAVFSFTATRPYSETEIQDAYDKWVPLLEKTLSDQLGSLINSYEKAVKDHPDSYVEDFDSFMSDLREAAKIRNVICHGSWRLPNQNGASIPFFVNRKKEVFETSIDCNFLDQLQKHTSELTAMVVSTVTAMGWQFPGSNGPGNAIWNRDSE